MSRLTKAELEAVIEEQRAEIAELKAQLEVKNTRNAGRKGKFSEAQIEQICLQRAQGMHLKDIAEYWGTPIPRIQRALKKGNYQKGE